MPDRKTSWIVAILLVTLGLFFLLVAYGVYRLFRPDQIELTQKSVLEIDLAMDIPELPPTSSLARLVNRETTSMVDLNRIFLAAAKDPQITSVYLSIHPLFMSWAQVEELRDFLKEFRRSNKKIFAHLQLDLAEEKELYLASLADQIYLNPDAGLLINGLAAEVRFYKRLMERLKVEPQFLQFKEFKSPETFTRESMTPEFRSMLEGILIDIQSRFLRTVAEERQIDHARLQELIKTGLTPASLALKERLVTALGYEDEVHSKLLAELAGSKEYRAIRPSQYLKVIDGRRGQRRHRVALLGGLGPITSGSSDEFWDETMGGETIAALLREIRKAKDIKGVLFRVDSPGGSAVGSDKIWREVRLLESNGKPVVASMSGVAGSGGYYIAMGARKIVALPSTITGSIGVIFGKFNVRGFFEQWLGITTDEIRLAQNANIFSLTQSLSEAQKNQIRSWMEEIYTNFVRKAAEGRGMAFEQLEAKAHGRIYTGAQAKELRLIDEVGGLATALSLLKKELKVPENEEVELVLYPKPKSFWKTLAEGDFFRTSLPRISVESVRARLRSLETPAPWLVAPEIDIH